VKVEPDCAIAVSKRPLTAPRSESSMIRNALRMDGVNGLSHALGDYIHLQDPASVELASCLLQLVLSAGVERKVPHAEDNRRANLRIHS